MTAVRIGSRGSRLALVQARFIARALTEHDPSCQVAIEVIETQGDRVTDRPLAEVGGSGIFIKEIERALLDGKIDVAVHSMKDLPSRLGEGLTIAATTERVDPRDALVSRAARDIDSLPEAATVATGSLRRRSQLLARRPDLRIEDLRGNVPTRLDKFDESSWDAIVLAGAGLKRLELEHRIRALIDVEVMTPAVGQGALGLETRSDDREAIARVSRLDHPASATAVEAERALLARLEGGCQVPIGAYGDRDGEALRLRAYVGSVDGSRHIRRERRGRPDEAEALGLGLAEEMLEAGAADIVSELAPRP